MKKSYSELLRDPRWQKKRLEILQRDEFTCQKCTDTESTLHIHHKKYIKGVYPWDYPNDLLTTLCHECHRLISEGLKFEDYFSLTINNNDSTTRISTCINRNTIIAIKFKEEDLWHYQVLTPEDTQSIINLLKYNNG